MLSKVDVFVILSACGINGLSEILECMSSVDGQSKLLNVAFKLGKRIRPRNYDY